jgi:hypothetical protein
LFTNNKNILFTFDYELFLGEKSGSVEKCLIEPTNILIQLFEKHKICNAIFFVDTTYLMRLKNEGNTETIKDFNRISNQLIELINKGHYVFPHIHPHWIDAKYLEEINQWSLINYSKYRFHNINDETKGKLFKESIQILEEFVKQSNQKYPINSYRAGGWSIQPFDDFINIFKKYGIKNDFSVIKGFKNNSAAQFLDFTNCPVSDVYRFVNDPCKENNQGEFTEFCISTIKLNLLQLKLNKLTNKILWKIGVRNFGDGLSLIIKDKSNIGQNKEMFGASNIEMLSIELLNISKLHAYKSFIRKNNFIHFISHPKMISLHNIQCFDNLLKSITKKYKIQTNFTYINSN